MMRSLRWIFLPALLAALFSSATQAGPVTIDSFMNPTSTITQTGEGTTTSSGTSGGGILGSRTISVTVDSTGLSSGQGSVAGGLAQTAFNGAYSLPNLANNFTLMETFGSTDATSGGANVYLDFVLGSTLGVTVTVTADGTSTYTFTDPVNTTGKNENIALSSFSDPSAFAHLTSLQFVLTFPNPGLSGPSAAFSGPVFFTPQAVPEPSSILLSVAGGMLLVGVRRSLARRKA